MVSRASTACWRLRKGQFSGLQRLPCEAAAVDQRPGALKIIDGNGFLLAQTGERDLLTGDGGFRFGQPRPRLLEIGLGLAHTAFIIKRIDPQQRIVPGDKSPPRQGQD